MIFSDTEAHQSDISQEERDILKQAVRELAEKIMRKCDKNSDDGLQNREAHDFLKDFRVGLPSTMMGGGGGWGHLDLAGRRSSAQA